MTENERLFLTYDEAIEALSNDFEQYPTQSTLLDGLMPLVFGDHAYLIRKASAPMVWVKTPGMKKPYPVKADQLGQWIVAHLIRQPVSLEQLARICTRVFQTPVTVASDGRGSTPQGLLVDTGMDDFICVQCGQCCRTLNYRDGCSVADYHRWQSLGRDDILQWVGVVRHAGRIVACRIWMEPGTNRYAAHCPWLKRSADQNRYTCTIHEVRPSICRQYPGSRKHARMTGCRGV